jgi:hypothetical protein
MIDKAPKKIWFDYRYQTVTTTPIDETDIPYIREDLAALRPEFAPLTEEELVACWGMPYSLSTEELRRFARAVEKATWKKNQ